MTTMDAFVLHLQNNGIGVGGETIFYGSDVHLPGMEVPRFITLAAAGGPGPVGAHNAKSMRRPTVQLTARSDEVALAYELCEMAFVAFGGEEKIANITIGDVFFLWIRPANEILQLPNDALNRVRYSFNIESQRR
jgi:hypothetical protein